MTTPPPGDPQALLARALAVIGVSGIGLVHLLDAVDTYHDTRYVFWLYVALMLGCLVAAGTLLHRGGPAAWVLTAAVAVAPLIGFVLSRTSGLPGSTDDIGNWGDPLGLASLWVEALTLALAGHVAVSGFGLARTRAERSRVRSGNDHLLAAQHRGR